jgi:phosphomannomutase
MKTVQETIQAARAFIAEDPDAATLAELQDLIEQAAEGDRRAIAELGDRFSANLEFGTAGLRGRVEAGTARMNRLVVIKATWGLGSQLLAQDAVLARSRGVVVGFDARHSSRQFAEDAAAVLGGLRIPALVFPDPVPTPLCAFAVRHIGAAAGIMITASHNPPADNGYKVYRADGAQIIPPQDREIANRIAEAPAGPQILRLQPPDAAARGLRRLIDDSVEAAYLAGVRSASFHEGDGTPLRIVYTAMHGVGHRLTIRALRQAGFEGVVSVAAQSDPDGAFRTVAFPNPEEKGAMDLALAAAAESGAELVLANDPDADRLAVAVPGPAGGYRMLSGNEIGWLLADDALAHADTLGMPKLVVTTIVSSTLLSRMARDRGARYAEVLTGFKWLADAERKAETEGVAFVAGYEEALGYTVGPLVRDKDGIGAAVRMAELARFLKARGETLLGRIDGLLVAHGLSHQVQWSVTRAEAGGRQRIAAAMATLRAEPPLELGGSPVERVLDAEAGEVRAADGSRSPSSLPKSDVLAFYAADGTRLIARPSGTEPKIKFYLEAVGHAPGRNEVPEVRAVLDERCQQIKAALMARLGFSG